MKRVLLITPFSDLVHESFYGNVKELLAGLDAAVSAAFGFAGARRGPLGESPPEDDMAAGPLPEPLPARAFNGRRRQYAATGLLAALAHKSKGLQRPGSHVAILGVTGADLFAPRLNFVFGMAEEAAATAVISFHRLIPEFYREAPDPDLFKERAAKEAIHEMGHVFGLSHCTSPGCIMRFSSTIADTDDKGPDFCGRCAVRLAQTLGSEKKL